MIVLTVLIACCALVLLLPTLSDALSAVRALPRLRRRRAAPATPPRLLFLVPAHDEELLIGACVRSLGELRYPAERMRTVVIADNCTDATAQTARAAGADCLERRDRANPGKPRAISWALQQLPIRDYDAVVIVDADTEADPALAAELARTPALRAGAVQAYHGVSNPDENSLTRMAAVLSSSRYHFEFPLKTAAGLNVPLMGNGMAIGTEVLAEHGWNAYSICEDWELYAQLTEKGVPITGAPAARVYSQEARSLKQSASQRRRWAAGKLTVMGSLLLPILRSRRISLPQKLDAAAELTALGPAVQLGLVFLLLALLQLAQPPLSAALQVALLLPIGRMAFYTLGALAREPRPLRAAAAFLFLPVYAVWRLSLQLSALTMLGDRPWVRTERHRA